MSQNGSPLKDGNLHETSLFSIYISDVGRFLEAPKCELFLDLILEQSPNTFFSLSDRLFSIIASIGVKMELFFVPGGVCKSPCFQAVATSGAFVLPPGPTLNPEANSARPDHRNWSRNGQNTSSNVDNFVP